jgi:hypothetical protein
MVWTGRLELPTSWIRTRHADQAALRPDECGRRESDPHTHDGYQALDLTCLPFHHFRVFAGAARASSGCRPPPPPVRTAGTRRRRRHETVAGATVVTLVRKARVALARPGGHQLLGLACLHSTTSAWRLPAGGAGGTVPTGGLAPPRPWRGTGVWARRVCVPPRRPVHRRRVGAGGGRTPYRDRTGDLLLEGEACRPFHQRGICGACRARTDRLLFAREVLFLMS